MNVEEIVLSAAKLLGIYDGVCAFYYDDNEELEREAKLLLSCFNLVESALALDYLPLHAEEVLRTSTGKMDFSSFAYAPIRIVKVTDANGNAEPYTLYPKYLKVRAGEWIVTYTYTPKPKEFEEESDYGIMGANHLFVYGVMAEYCLSEGRLEEAAMWDKKFKEAIESIYHTSSCQRLSSRRWI